MVGNDDRVDRRLLGVVGFDGAFTSVIFCTGLTGDAWGEPSSPDEHGDPVRVIRCSRSSCNSSSSFSATGDLATAKADAACDARSRWIMLANSAAFIVARAR